MPVVTIAGTAITGFADLNTVPTGDLLAYYNNITGKTTKQFLKRAKGMQQVWALVEPLLPQAEKSAHANVEEAAAALEQTVNGNACSAHAATLAPSKALRTTRNPPEDTPSHEASPIGLKARVDDLLVALASGPRTVAELAEMLGMDQKKARSTIDTARRVGHTIACVGRGTFALPEAAQ
ncbi:MULTISPECIES: hypothetical protein [Gammaproteobacteria]|uniref:hypothetical protein n=1 Tax=Gammaproteobacteria TaxID=1236 RepID=UPI003A9000E3